MPDVYFFFFFLVVCCDLGLRHSGWFLMLRDSVVVLSSRVDMFFVDISAVEYETTMLFHNIGYRSLSDTVTQCGKIETSAVALRKSTCNIIFSLVFKRTAFSLWYATPDMAFLPSRVT